MNWPLPKRTRVGRLRQGAGARWLCVIFCAEYSKHLRPAPGIPGVVQMRKMMADNISIEIERMKPRAAMCEARANSHETEIYAILVTASNQLQHAVKYSH